MPANWEFKRKFVMTFTPEGLLTTRKPTPVRKGYIAYSEERQVILCDKNGQFTLSACVGSGHRVQHSAISLSQEQFDGLWPQTQNYRTSLVRYEVPYFGAMLTIDEYSEHLAPLKLVTARFTDEVTCRQFLAPDFAQTEVTHVKEFSTEALARLGLPDVSAIIGQASMYS